MPWPPTTDWPSLATREKFLTFLRNVAGIPVRFLPDDSLQVDYALAQSQNIVNDDLALAPSSRLPSGAPAWSPYELAVYNLGTHLLIEYGQDPSYPITALSWASGLATGTVADSSNIMPGDQVKIVAVSPIGYQGAVVNGVRRSGVMINGVPDATHFDYALQPNPGTAVLLAGASVVEQYFANARAQLKLNAFSPGVVTNASDLSTSAGLQLPNFMQGLTLMDLSLLKTQFGRSYLAIAQDYGPTAWGVT